ncbi:VCBS repeat-containing protein [Streptomyces sp. NPDC000410]|uniref:FG-GAP repeat domain-containing protein n=1 Tax=Streptomyces sp. NPDC000410 TaxID=3154254 RepID=UPI00332EA999
MHKSKIIGVALVPTLTLTLGVVGAGITTALVTAAPAAAAEAGPWAWGAQSALSAAGEHNSLQGLKITSDGTAVLVFVRKAADGGQELWARTQPAKSTAWSAPTRVAELPGTVVVKLITGQDGSATVAWLDYYTGGVGYTYSSSTLLAGAGAWTPPARISTVSDPAWLSLASGPDGRLVAVWTSFGDLAQGRAGEGLYVSELPARGVAWSTPVKFTDNLSYDPSATVAPDGTTTVAWRDSYDLGNEPLARVVTRAPGATEWSTPQGIGSGSVDGVRLQSAANGATLLSWVQTGSQHFAYRPAGSTQWGGAEAFPEATNSFVTPLLGPAGEVTAVWDNFDGLRTATRSATGTWTQPQTLSKFGVNTLWEPSVGADGTVNLLWVDGKQLMAATRTGGTWAQPVAVGQAHTEALGPTGKSVTDKDGRAVAVWNRETGSDSKGDDIHQMWTVASSPRPATPAKRRDYVGNDGFPDLYARSATGALLVYQGNANHAVSAKADGGIWPTTSTIVPFGDLDGDGTNDTLVREADGVLYRYSPPRGKAVTPQSGHVMVSTGWERYDGLTYSGDLTGDKRPDLVAREIATGDLHLFAATTTGGLASLGKKIGTSWKSLTIVGAGDLNGDKHADLVARTTTGDLYRYYGTGKGTISSGAKIGSGWGGMADFVGIGDLTRDGKDDILGRTKTGDLYRYNGNGTGGIGSGTKIGTGWKNFTSVS